MRIHAPGEKEVAISSDRPRVASVSASMRHRLGSSSNTSDSRPPTSVNERDVSTRAEST